MDKKERSLIPGVVLILIGTYFLLDQLDVFYFRWPHFYPVLMLVLAVLFFGAVFVRKDKGAVFPATVLLVLGAFFFVRNYDFTPLGYYMYDIEDFWPIFLVAFGLGFIALFLVRRDDWGVLIPGSLLLFFGTVFLLRTTGIFYWRTFSGFWPVILIAIGLAIVVSNLRKKPNEET